MATCKGITKTGTQCRLPVAEGQEYCWHHLPTEPTVEENLSQLPNGQLQFKEIFRRITVYSLNHQAIIIGVVFALTFLFSRNNTYIASILSIPNELAIGFLAAISQAIASLLGLLIAFLLFRMQSVDEQRSNTYQQYKSEMLQILRLAHTRPSDLAVFDNELDLIKEFSYFRMEDMPHVFFEGRGKETWEKVIKRLIGKWKKLNTNVSPEAQMHSEQIIVALFNVEDALSRMGVQYIATITIGFMLTAINRLSFLLGFSLILILALGMVDRRNIFPDLTLPSIFATLIWLLLILYELARETRMLYRNFHGGWLTDS